ncbi:MAG: solute-binding protein [Actinobacteria bacterium]|nr:solute-binding protein [Actinomycetota bacterium]
MRKSTVIAVSLSVALALLIVVAGCGEKKSGTAEPVERAELILATTTSTQDSGLLDEWIPMFEKDNPYSVKVIAVGSGEAMQMGRDGECDVMLVHSPSAEEQMVAEGYAVDRRAVMHNDFLIVGPASDPAGVKGAASAAEAFAAIYGARSRFISRGDESGTHTKELSIWKKAGIEPQGEWYVESGKGMGDTLRIASEDGAYTLADRGTYLSMKDELDLEVLCEGDPALFNNYHVMNVNPEKWPDVNYEGAKAFNDFCVSAEAQEFLDEFGVDEYGQQLFYPDAL